MNEFSLSRIKAGARYDLDEIRRRVTCSDVLTSHGVEWSGRDICCPFPDHDDRTPSFGLVDGAKAFRCHGCDRGGDVFELESELSGIEFPEAVARLADRCGVEPTELKKVSTGGKKIVCEYVYTDPGGNPVGKVIRYEPKSFSQKKAVPGGGWSPEAFDPVPFNLVEVVKAVEAGKVVTLCEGEKDCQALASVGIVATCNPGGAGKWSASLSEYLRGGKVVIFADRDEPGTRHAAAVVKSLRGIAERVTCYRLRHDGQPLKDPADWVAAGGTKSDSGDFEPFDPEKELAEASEKVESVKQGVFFISNSRGVGCYYLRKPDGKFLALKEPTLARHLQRAGMSAKKKKGEAESEIGNFLLDAQLNSALDYAGNLAGWDAGIHEQGGTRFLSMRSPVTPSPAPGEFKTLQAVFHGLFPDDENRLRFEAWLFHAWECLHRRKWAPLPVLALAGPRNCGKSLLVSLLGHVLGGTEPGQAFRFISGETAFNADLAGAHLLVVDDEISSTDMRTRRATGQRIKSLAVTNSHRIEPKGFDAVTLSPHWRAVFATNDEPEALQVLPPVDDGLRDKLLLLRCRRAEMPMPSASPDERAAFMKQLKADVPCFLHLMREAEHVKAYGDSRQAVTGWQDPVLLESLQSLDAERQLLDLIDILRPWDCISGNWIGTAAELESLLGQDPSTSRKSDRLLSWGSACGSYLERLSHSHPERVRRHGPARLRGWEILAP